MLGRAWSATCFAERHGACPQALAVLSFWSLLSVCLLYMVLAALQRPSMTADKRAIRVRAPHSRFDYVARADPSARRVRGERTGAGAEMGAIWLGGSR